MSTFSSFFRIEHFLILKCTKIDFWWGRDFLPHPNILRRKVLSKCTDKTRCAKNISDAKKESKFYPKRSRRKTKRPSKRYLLKALENTHTSFHANYSIHNYVVVAMFSTLSTQRPPFSSPSGESLFSTWSIWFFQPPSSVSSTSWCSYCHQLHRWVEKWLASMIIETSQHFLRRKSQP